MIPVVIDSSILLASVLLDESLTTEAQRLLAEWSKLRIQLTAPRLFRSEIVAVIRKAVFQKRISDTYAQQLLDETLSFPIDYYHDNALMKRAYGIATDFNLPRTYDAQYLALAERLTCEFWTTDKTLLNTLGMQFSLIRWLGNYSAT